MTREVHVVEVNHQKGEIIDITTTTLREEQMRHLAIMLTSFVIVVAEKGTFPEDVEPTLMSTENV